MIPILFIDFSPEGLVELIKEYPALVDARLLDRLRDPRAKQNKPAKIRITQSTINKIVLENDTGTLDIFCQILQKTPYIPVETPLIIFCFPRIANVWNVKEIKTYGAYRRLCIRSRGEFSCIRKHLEAVWVKIQQTPSEDDDPLDTLITRLIESQSLFNITRSFLGRGRSSPRNQTRKRTSTLTIPMNQPHTTAEEERIDNSRMGIMTSKPYNTTSPSSPETPISTTSIDRSAVRDHVLLPQHRKTNKHALQVMMLYTALSAIALSLVLVHYGYCLTFMHSFSLGANVTFATFFVGIALIARQIKLYSGFNGSTKIQSSTRYLFNDTIGMFGNPVGLNIASILTFLVLSEHLPTLFSLSKGSTTIVVSIAALIVVNTIDRACSHRLRAQLYKDSERPSPDDLLKPAPSTYYQPAALSLLLYEYYTTRQTTPVTHSNALKPDNNDCKMEFPKR